MWYVSVIYTSYGIVSFEDNFSKSTALSYICIKNKDNNVIKVLKNINSNSSISNELLKKYTSDKNNIMLLDFSNISGMKQILQNYGISDIYGVDYDNDYMFSTTDFGLELYNIIEFLDEKDLVDKPVSKLYYTLLCNDVIYSIGDDDFTTLDRIVLNKDCLITKDNRIIIFDESVQYEYNIKDKVKFVKLLTLKGKVK